MEIIISFITATVIMGFLDFLWLTVIAKKLYYAEMGSLLRKKPTLPAAMGFYVIYLFGLMVLVIEPALARDSVYFAASMGATVGFVAYATYDLTNLATLKGFSPKIAFIDIAWGTILTLLTATGAVAVAGLM